MLIGKKKQLCHSLKRIKGQGASSKSLPGYKAETFTKKIIPKSHLQIGVSKNRGTPKWMVYNGKLKWTIWGYHYFRKHPNLAQPGWTQKFSHLEQQRGPLSAAYRRQFLQSHYNLGCQKSHGKKNAAIFVNLNFFQIWVFPKIMGTPKSSIIIGLCIINKPFILGYPYFWKHPFRTWENGEEYPISPPSAHLETDVPPPAHKFQLPSAFEGTAKPKLRHLFFSEC